MPVVEFSLSDQVDARLGYLLIYLPTQVQLTLMKIIKIVATR